jgi:hypothetical protein
LVIAVKCLKLRGKSDISGLSVARSPAWAEHGQNGLKIDAEARLDVQHYGA